MRGRNTQAAQAIQAVVRQHVNQESASTSPPRLQRATLVVNGSHVVLVEECESRQDFNVAIARQSDSATDNSLTNKLAPLVAAPPTKEFFPHALHIYKDSGQQNLNTEMGQEASSFS